MLDVYTALDLALRSRFLVPLDLPGVALWGRLSAELSQALDTALGSGGDIETVRHALWTHSASLNRKRRADDDDEATTYVRVRLGMQYLAHLKGNLGADELLSHAFHTADSYVWDEPQQQDFLDRRREVARDGPDGVKLAILFEPYLDAATRYVKEWGLA